MRRGGRRLRHHCSWQPKTLEQEGASSDPAGGPSDAGWCRQTGINTKFLLDRENGRQSTEAYLTSQRSLLGAQAVLLLPPAYRQAAINALHQDKHTSQQQINKMARDWYLWQFDITLPKLWYKNGVFGEIFGCSGLWHSLSKNGLP